MNVLLIYLENQETWSGNKHILYFVNKKATFPPLGLLTISPLLPSSWNKKLIDLNVTTLKETDIDWADYVFISGMNIHEQSAEEVIKKIKKKGKFIVAGGPLFTYNFKKYKDVDCFVLNEGEITIPLFLRDLEKGQLERVYTSAEKPDITKNPIPDWSLINIKDYLSMPIQISRGCPHNCEFCDIIIYNGRVPRYKSPEQVIAEFTALYETGFRGGVFIVDDNFIGHINKTKQILIELAKWTKEKNYPFKLHTQLSINIADNTELLQLMNKVNFNSVFIGIESPDEESLLSVGKIQNTNKNLIEKVNILQRNGLEVISGYILGFDTDTTYKFDKMIEFIQQSGIVLSMAGLLVIYPETILYKRLQKEGRILAEPSSNNSNFSLNYIPKMDKEELITSYKKTLKSIYSPKNYYARIITFLKEYKKTSIDIKLGIIDQLRVFFMVIWYIGLWNKGMIYFWKTIFWTLYNKPYYIPETVKFSIFRYHFINIMKQQKLL
jgi:radical SAM superfamily enzyme YgiQ (UPF0313 family)